MASTAPFIENGLPFILTGAPRGHIHHQPPLSSISSVPLDYPSPLSYQQSSRRKSSTRSMSSASSSSSASISGKLRLADLAKRHSMGVHTEAWREDMLPVRQYLPMQHIIGSLKRDRDAEVGPIYPGRSPHNTKARARHSVSDDVSAASPRSEDSFLELLRTPKRRRTMESSQADSPITASNDFDEQLNYQAVDQVHKDIPRSALPGLNHVLNLSTLTPSERDVFSEYAPQHLEDPQVLMNEVLQLRGDMMEDKEEHDDDNDAATTAATFPSVVPPERDIEVRKAFEEFIDFNDSKRYIAKI